MPRIKSFDFLGQEMEFVSVTDTTLSQEAIPGDAKVIGDKFEELNTKVDNLVVGEAKVFNADTHFDFPSIGKIDCIYKAYKEKKTYQWNEETLAYEALDENESNIENINLINGGNANGIL